MREAMLKRTWMQVLGLCLMATLLVTAAACGGGGEEPAPAEDGTADEAPEEAPAESAAADLEPGNAAVQGLGDGSASVTGTVTFVGDVPTLNPVSMDADPQCAAKHEGPVYPQTLVLGEGNTMANIFVKVVNAPAGDHSVSEPAVVDQNGCRYHPHVMGVLAGQPLVFLNSDGLLHNVHGLPQQNREFNLGMPASRLQAAVENLNTPEPLFPVKCDVHPWMQSFVAVMEHPYFDVTAEDGVFEISGLPPGDYEIEAWHERLGTRTASVTVGEGETASASFEFDVPQG